MTSDPDSMTRSPPLGKQPSQCKAGGASPHEGPPVNVGDLVLCRLGCKYWPAICSELPTDGGRSDKARFIFFGDHKELVTSVASARRSVRPFSDLSQLAARDKPSCHLYDVAVEEAQQWHGDMQLYHHAHKDGDSVVAEQHAHEATLAVNEVPSPHDDPGDGNWTINGEVVPLQLLLRANLRRLPKYGSTALVPVSTPLSPAPTFRVINDIGSTSRGGGSSSSAFKDATFARRHAGLEQLEKRGYAAQPRAALVHGAEGEDAAGARSGAAKWEEKRQRKRARSSEEKEVDALLGRRVCVPASEFPDCEADPGVSCYDGMITGRRASGDGKKGKKKKGGARERGGAGSELEVYFASDHTTCLLSVQQAQQWLVPFEEEEGEEPTEAVQDEGGDEQAAVGGEQAAVGDEQAAVGEEASRQPSDVSDSDLAKQLGVHRSTIWRRKQKALKMRKQAVGRTSTAAPSREATSSAAAGVTVARAAAPSQPPAAAQQQLPVAMPLDRPRRSCRGPDFDSVTLRLAGIPSPSDACSAEA